MYRVTRCISRSIRPSWGNRSTFISTCFPSLTNAWPGAVVSMADVFSTICHATSMNRIMMPRSGIPIMDNMPAVEIPARIVVIVVVYYHDMMIMPVEGAEKETK